MKKYLATLTQTGTNAPDPTERVNTFDEEITFEYLSKGNYLCKIEGGFPADVIIPHPSVTDFENNQGLYYYRNDNGDIQITTWTDVIGQPTATTSDDVLGHMIGSNGTVIEFHVYDS